MSCSWCGKEYKVGDDVIDRMEWCSIQEGWEIWNGDTIHRDCDCIRYDTILFNDELKRLRRLKQNKITDYFN